MANGSIFIGLMSGTSLDGIDAVAVRTTPSFQLIGSGSYPLPDITRQQILALCQPGENEIDRMGALDVALADLFADATLVLLSKLELSASEVRAIGSHGQTIRHRPEQEFTLQIGDANRIAERTGITTVADFRRRDIAAGGQGAPLVPAFHQALFRDEDIRRVIANVGGMANITVLPPNGSGTVTGYDTGPGNVLMDAWIQTCRGLSYDANGDWARHGQVDATLLSRLMDLPFFSAPAPKSTGREQFNLSWLEGHLSAMEQPVSAEDVQATLLELTARTITEEILRHGGQGSLEVYLCGGGSHNRALIDRLRQLLQPTLVETTDRLGIHPDWVEACAFAWLAHQTLSGAAGNLPDVTGALGPRVLGAIYPA